MKMYRAVWLIFLATSLGPGIAVAAAATGAGDRPNFVLIIGDDISAEDLGCFGNPGIRTPNIDRLAAESRRFTNAYVTASSCSPSRCSILASRYPHNLETAAELHGPLPPGVALFPQLLRDAGYFTVQAGKAHFGEVGAHIIGPAREAFEVSSSGDRGELNAGDGGENKWVQHLRDRPKDKPFFMWFASFDAHREWGSNSFSGINRPSDVTVPPQLVDTPETRQDLARYYDEITRLDHYVGEVIHELRRQDVLEQTIVLFLSDNGRPFPRSKTRVFDDGMKTPLLIRWRSAAPQPGSTNALVSAIDIAPTVLELAGLSPPASFQGVSLMPVLRDARAQVRDYVFAEQNWHNFPAHVRMVRSGDFVYVRNAWPELPLPGASDTFYNPSAEALKRRHAEGGLTPIQRDVFLQPRPAEEFYDLRSDPRQASNLVSSTGRPKAELDRLRAILTTWQQETGDTVPARRTAADVDYASGKKTGKVLRGTPPGADARALTINHPGPIREKL